MYGRQRFTKLVLKVSLRYPYGYLSHLTDMLTKADKINCSSKLLPHCQYNEKFKDIKKR